MTKEYPQERDIGVGCVKQAATEDAAADAELLSVELKEVERLRAENAALRDMLKRSEKDEIAEFALSADAAQGGKACRWALDSDGFWRGACGTLWEFTSGGPAANGVRYCYGCGRKVEVVTDSADGKLRLFYHGIAAVAANVIKATPQEVEKLHAMADRCADSSTNDRVRGLYRKYEVRRVDGSSEPGGKHAACEYFVLDLTHDPHANAALLAYVESCEQEYPKLAQDLIDKYLSDGERFR